MLPVLNDLTVSQYDNTSPIKYLYAPNHQILVKSASRKARNCIKADLATKVRNQVKHVLMWTVTNNKALKLVFHVWGGTFDSNSLFNGGTFESKTCDCYIGLTECCHQSNVTHLHPSHLIVTTLCASWCIAARHLARETIFEIKINQSWVSHC